MKQITINTYSASELKQEYPEGFERAHNKYIEETTEYGIAWGDEIMESLKGLIKATNGISLRDWSINGTNPSQSYIKLTWDTDEARDLYGARAMAWLENNLLADLRIGFNSNKRWELSKYGKYYRAGMIKPCPFTGVCFDEDFLESLTNDIKAGETIGDSFSNLADVAAKLYEAELEYELSEENFLEMSDEWAYDEDGNLI